MAAVRRQPHRALCAAAGFILCAAGWWPPQGWAQSPPAAGFGPGGTPDGQGGSVGAKLSPGAPPRYEAIPPGVSQPPSYDVGPSLGDAGAKPPVEAIPPGYDVTRPGEPKRTANVPLPEDDTEDILEVRLIGNRAVTPEQFKRMTRTREGRKFERKLVEDDVLALIKTRKFLDVKTLYERPPEGGIIVIFQVAERPTIEFVRYVGAVKIKPKKLAKETELKVGDPMDPSAVKEGLRKIEEQYKKKGHNDVRITIVQGTRYDDRGVEYLINEGESQRIQRVEFVGNELASGQRLKTQIKSKPPLLYMFKGYVSEETLDEDVQRLTAYYRSLGYFRARIGREIRFNEKQNWATLTFVIDEGPRYRVRNVSFVGNKKFSQEEWEGKLKLKPGDNFDQAYLTRDQTMVQDFYGGRGYIFCNPQPDFRFLEEPGQMDLVYEIDEGARYRVGRIDVRINGDHPHTRNRVALNRLDLRPGDIVDTRKIRDAERRLKATGVFQNDPSKGSVPKIVLLPPDEGGSKMARPGKGGSVRGQSPDDDPPEQFLDVGLDGVPFIPGQQPTVTAARPVVRGQSPDTAQNNAGGPRPVRGRAGRPTTATRSAPSSPDWIFRGQFTPGEGEALPEMPRSRPAYPVAQPAYAPPTQGQAQFQPGEEVVPQVDGAVQPNIVGGNAFPENPALDPNTPIIGDPPPPDRYIDPVIVATETQTGRLMFGVGVNSSAGVVGNIVLDEQNFDWRRVPTSWEDIRNATAFRGAGQQFRIEAVPGTQLQRYTVTFREPYFLDTPVSLGLSGYYYTRFYQEWTEQRIGGRPSLGYQLTPDLSATVSLRAEQVKIFNPEGGGVYPATPQAIIDAQGTHALYGISMQIAHDTRDSAFLPTEGHYLQAGFEQVLGSYTFPIGSVEGRQYFLVHQRPDRSGRQVLSFTGTLGIMGNNAPVFEKYFAGGFSSIRGFRFRGASPVDPANGIAVGGTFQYIGSVEYMFPLTADDALRGVVFFDYGTISNGVQFNTDNIRMAPGFGLRITVPGMGPAPIALDLAFPIATAPGDHIQNFSFFVGLLR